MWDLQNIFNMVLWNTLTTNFYFHEVIASTNQHFFKWKKKRKRKALNLWNLCDEQEKKAKRTSWKRQPSCPLTHLLIKNKMLLWSIESLLSEHFLLLCFLHRCISLFYAVNSSFFIQENSMFPPSLHSVVSVFPVVLNSFNYCRRVCIYL